LFDRFWYFGVRSCAILLSFNPLTRTPCKYGVELWEFFLPRPFNRFEKFSFWTLLPGQLFDKKILLFIWYLASETSGDFFLKNKNIAFIMRILPHFRNKNRSKNGFVILILKKSDFCVLTTHTHVWCWQNIKTASRLCLN